MLIRMFFFFKQKTAYEMRISDWSSDVCSSDLGNHVAPADRHLLEAQDPAHRVDIAGLAVDRLAGCDEVVVDLARVVHQELETDADRLPGRIFGGRRGQGLNALHYRRVRGPAAGRVQDDTIDLPGIVERPMGRAPASPRL